MNLDTGAAANTFTLNFGPEGAGDGRFYRTASGDWIPDDGASQFSRIRRERVASISERKTPWGTHGVVLQRLLAWADKISTWDMTVDT